jgi:hypothetical protein
MLIYGDGPDLIKKRGDSAVPCSSMNLYLFIVHLYFWF